MTDQSSEPTTAQSSTADTSSTQQFDDDHREHKPINPKLSRKRTKTGCLTCRRRRIKCGEERPTCTNCIKSKRQCEGYNQRVIFKDPLNAYRGPPIPRPGVSSPPGTFGGPSGTPYGQFPPLSQQTQPSLPTIAPKPEFNPGYSDPHDHASAYMLSNLTSHSDHSSHSDIAPFAGSLLGQQGIGPIRQQSISSSTYHSSPPYTSMSGAQPLLTTSQMQQMPDFVSGNNDTYRSVIMEPLRIPVVLQDELDPYSKRGLDSAIFRYSAMDIFHQQSARSAHKANLFGSELASPSKQLDKAAMGQTIETNFFESPNIESSQSHPSQQQLEGLSPSHTFSRHSGSPTSQQDQYAQGYPDYMTQQIWEEEDDLYDVSDDDVYMNEPEEALGLEAGNSNSRQVLVDVRNVVALQTVQQQKVRGFRSFANALDHENSLSTYQPTFQSTPLKDSKTALVFAHFVNVTGPSLSMFERHPANPSLMFNGSTIPMNQRHIWTYTIPTMALTNQALLHACLAISSLHIAKLQGRPVIVSLKHYHISLRRVARSVSLPTRRGHPAVVAATMLLGYYEVMAADHQKWTNHLLGAKQLLREIDYVGMTRYKRSLKRQQRAFNQANNIAMIDDYGQFSMPQQEDMSDIDENLISNLIGRAVRYDSPANVDELSQYNLPKATTQKTYTPKEMEMYEFQRDLWWWFCKQDVYQSILGGNRLFLDYERWSDCPPRAPMGRLDLPVGNFDHLVLVMARLAEFTAKDLKRKRKEMAANRGQWRPPPGFQMPGPPPSQSSQSSSRPAPPPMPNFPGMMPIPGEARLPMGFSARDESPASTIEDEETDLAAAKERAEEEWQSIRQAFALLESNFGPDYQPLGPEHTQPKHSPFGPALQYRSYQVVCTWLNYYMGYITLMRAHPSMPPAMAVATGIAAAQTGPYANTIGRIFAGIMPEYTTEVTPSVGSVLVESTVSVFCASVQYQDNAQRKWIVHSLRSVTRLTGWQTAQVIATGLENSWLKAAEMGKGPPYQKDEEGTERILDAALHGGRLHSVLHKKSINHDNSIVVADRTDRVHWALGLLAAQEDLDSLTLKDDDE